MSDAEDKTEDPTSKRLSDARNKGQTVVSQEVKNWFMLLGGMIFISVMLPNAAQTMMQELKRYLATPHQVGLDYASNAAMVGKTVGVVLVAFLPGFLMLMIFGIAGGFIQHGPMIASEVLKFDFKKLNPWSGLKKLLSPRSLVEMVKNILKLAIIGSVVYVMITPVLQRLEIYPNMPIPELIKDTRYFVLRVMGGVVAILGLIAVLDYLYQRQQFMKSMRMSKEEVKEEMKQSDGDPKIKGRIRQLRMQRARQRMMQAVPNADVIITNPTHFAVALEYKPDSMNAPKVVAKGMDLIAQRIREIAEENKVPLVSNPPLARALHDSAEIDSDIPLAHYQAVAEVISYIFKLKQKARR